jgi:hypothetical protein
MATPEPQPSPEDRRKMEEVAQAGAEAAATGPPEGATDRAGAAMRAERDRVDLKMSDEDIDRIAGALSPKLIDGFRDAGAFDAPPEPPRPPANTAPPAPGETAEPAPAAAAGEPAPAPRRQTFAHRFMGIRE